VTTFGQIEAEVRRLAALRPDFVYERPGAGRWCQYTRTEEGGVIVGDCIFGQALIAAGVKPEHIRRLEHKDIEMVLRALDIPTSPREREWAACVQERQDKANAWASAIAYADHTYPLRFP
jgi:hypothetical protein